MNKRFTPDKITDLAVNEIFVFGSNLKGKHGGGAARLALNRFGAVWGQGVGLQGQSYAIPTMHGGLESIKPYVDDFIRFAEQNKQFTFLVTRIGCGVAGFRDEQIAPLFIDALPLDNVVLPVEFVECLEHCATTVQNDNAASWASNDFLDLYHPLMRKVALGDKVAYKRIKELRIHEYYNTIQIVNQGFYTTEDGMCVSFPDSTRMVHDAVFYQHVFRVDDVPPCGEPTRFIVRNADSLEEGLRLLREGYNPAVLNMANREVPGGGVLSGAGAQEESLFRRTNLFRSLYQFSERFISCDWFKDHISLAKTGERYPMNRDFGGVYTPDAILFRDDEQHGYKLMSDPAHLAFISVAAINHPVLKDQSHLANIMVDATKNKMRTILRIGLRHGHDALVLGAFGCGAFRNPPSHIAHLFHEVFEEPEFRDKYRLISFAILDDHNAHHFHNPEGNYMPFVQEFSANGSHALSSACLRHPSTLYRARFAPCLEWSLLSDGTLVISGSGRMPDYTNHWDSYFGENQAPWIGCEKYGVLPYKLRICEGITYVGANAFESFGCLEEVFLPESVTQLGAMAFFDCFNIKKINVPHNMTLEQFNIAELPMFYNNEYSLNDDLLLYNK